MFPLAEEDKTIGVKPVMTTANFDVPSKIICCGGTA